MKRVVLVTAHYVDSKRKAGFHWMADAWWRSGCDVLFFTESISWLSWLRGDQRFQYPIFRDANRLRRLRDRFHSYVWFTPFHPGNLRLELFNRLSRPLFRHYPRLALAPDVSRRIAGADLFVFDSTHGLFLFDRFKQMNPTARFAYRVSDDIPLMANHPLLQETEERVAHRFDLVSVPSEYIHRRFVHLPQARLHKHGLRTQLFDKTRRCPYPDTGSGRRDPRVIYVGRNYFDHDFLRRAIRLFPTWSFHVFGAIPDLPSAANLVAYGERPYEDMIPYLQHADIGLQSLVYKPGAESFTDSLKMQQYTYCRLPIVAPRFLRSARPHVFYYLPGDDRTIRQALVDAAGFDRSKISLDDIWSWDEMVSRLAA
jgi:2-beta-glucuronyltransferase